MSTDNPELDAWRAQWREVGEFEHDRPWRLGQLFNEGRRFIEAGEKDEKAISRAVEKLIPAGAIESKTVRQFAYVEAAFPVDIRNPRLTWQHHREIWGAGVVAAQQQKKWLERAEVEGMSTRDLRVALANSKGGGERNEKAKKYGVEFVLVNWADQGVAGINDLFPPDKPINARLLEAAIRETSGLVDAMRRVGII